MSISVVSMFKITMETPQELHAFNQLHHINVATSGLRHLILRDTAAVVLPIREFLLQLKNASYIKHLRRSEIRIEPPSWEWDQRLLLACAETLRYLVLDPGGKDFPYSMFHPNPVSDEDQGRCGREPVASGPLSSDLRESCDFVPLLETITFAFLVWPLDHEFAWTNQGPLPILGASFMTRTELLGLRLVHCKLLRRDPQRLMDTLFIRFIAAMESYMPGLKGTEILTCSSPSGIQSNKNKRITRQGSDKTSWIPAGPPRRLFW
ncbi:hypothetical protein C8R43DRAFT_962497 [Mycena crocata]|nr:hypothetical protein C8R43DRAFT_962497 [Mycena crocata]